MFEEKETMIRLLNALFPKAKIYLFGSYAQGTNRPGSDIDLALDTGKKLSIRDIQRAKNILECLNMAQTIDIVDINSIPDSFKESIQKEAILWKN